MADIKFSGLPAADTLTGDEIVPVVQGGASKRTTAQDIANLGGGSSGGAVVIDQVLNVTGQSSFVLEAFAGKGYAEVEVTIDGVFSDNGANLTGTLKLNGTYKNTNYRTTWAAYSSSGIASSDNSTNTAAFNTTSAGGTWGVGNAAGSGMHSRITLPNPDGTLQNKGGFIKALWTFPSGNIGTSSRCGFRYDGSDATAPIGGVRFAASSGTFTGKVIVKGTIA